MKRAIVEPNWGFEVQLKMYEKMRWSLEGESEAHEYFKRFLDTRGGWDSEMFLREIMREMPVWLK